MIDWEKETPVQVSERAARRAIEAISRVGTLNTDVVELTARVDGLTELCNVLVEEMAKLIEHTYNGDNDE